MTSAEVEKNMVASLKGAGFKPEVLESSDSFVRMHAIKAGVTISAVWRAKNGVSLYHNQDYTTTQAMPYSVSEEIKALEYTGNSILKAWNEKNFVAMVASCYNQAALIAKTWQAMLEGDNALITWFSTLPGVKRQEYQDRAWLVAEHGPFRFEITYTVKSKKVTATNIQCYHRLVADFPGDFKAKVLDFLTNYKVQTDSKL